MVINWCYVLVEITVLTMYTVIDLVNLRRLAWRNLPETQVKLGLIVM